jgi:transcriptional regulator with XRE-family HTH domain
MASTTAQDLGRSIREARLRAGLTQADLGEFVGGADRHMIASLERGEFTTQMRRLLSILDAVGLEIALTPRSARLAADTGVPDEVR